MAKCTQSNQYAAQVAGAANFSSRIDDKRQVMGDVQFASIVVPLTADNVATDVITLIQLPPGAIVLPELSKFISTADFNDSTFVVDVGDVVDVDRYSDGANLAAVGTVDFCVAFPAGFVTKTPVVQTGVATTDTSLIILTITTEGGTMAAGNLVVVLAYKCL